ncbi:hypothetical protein [Cellulosimicrobium protaetiae]|uniref:Uncharacterized protein n=1 Tax=Cellulosimicrobium protaetiae TaxID=2587808 RepID=A0A6M5UHW9_9MICO|nr:hypothetical protein [Cellulosimicrobium protaetiae]QJW36813.1 hypothetical protein FIC82_012030 [Cellulosimicrobium protaetiae]
MSTTTYAPRLDARRSAGRTVDPSDGRRRLAGPVAPTPSRTRSGIGSRTLVATAPFTGISPDGRRPRRALTTTLVTLAWLPALALTLVAFAVVGVAAGVATVAVWAWRSVSPVRTPRTGADDADASRDELDPSATPTGRPRGRRLVRDRTLGYDA